mgnify:FL=1
MRYLSGILTIITVLMISAAQTDAQRTTRRLHHASSDIPAAVSHRDSTAVNPGDSLFAVSGYEKTLRSRRETFFITNRGDSAVKALAMTIDYLDMHGHKLDRRAITVDTDLPAGETRRVDIAAWDRQQALYYYLSPAPRRTTVATPYKVRIAVTHIIH